MGGGGGCSNHGFCTNGQCICYEGWKGMNCSAAEVDAVVAKPPEDSTEIAQMCAMGCTNECLAPCASSSDPTCAGKCQGSRVPCCMTQKGSATGRGKAPGLTVG